MTQYIDKSALVAEIERLTDVVCQELLTEASIGVEYFSERLLSLIDTLEVKGVDYNNGWIDCLRQMPKETKQWSDTRQGHKEWTESNLVLAWDSMYGCRVDCTRNGKWMSEQRDGCTGQIVHDIIAWRPIPEFSEELLLKEQKDE